MSHPETANPGTQVDRPHALPPRKHLRGKVVLLFVATILLIVFILLLGDIRRKRSALHEARAFAAALSDRMGDTRTLPLNLEVADTEPVPRVYRFEWLARDEARRLRDRTGRVVAAWSSPVPQFLAPDGRTVILFESGAFTFEWQTLATLDRALEAQREHLPGSTHAPTP